MLWFLLGLCVGGILGMMLLALMVAAKEADEHLKGDNDMPAECFWCGERMMKTNNDMYVCPSCGWRWRGKDEK